MFFYNSLIEGKAKWVKDDKGKELVIDSKEITELYKNRCIKVEKPVGDYGKNVLDDCFNDKF